MDIIEERQKDLMILRVGGQLDLNTAPLLEEKINASMEAGQQRLIIDFEQLEYISSAGMRVILKTSKALKRQQGALMLCAMQDYVKEVFEIAGFDSFLSITGSLEEARESI